MEYNRIEFTFVEDESGQINSITVPLEPSVGDIVFTQVKE